MASWHVVGGEQVETTKLFQGSITGLRDVVEIPVMIDSGPSQGMQITVDIPSQKKTDTGYITAEIQAAVDAHDVIGGLRG
jgi:hypothetical protein